MCRSAILWTGIEAVLFGSSIKFLQKLGWKQIDISSREVAERTHFQNCSIIEEILEEECNSLFVVASQDYQR
ncbi:MAG TPA: hypothetical protein DD473_19295 [Planctomycetaceae bacterium]|nr:hypothetical protein [Planctomycetaceae bacterium]